MSIARYKENSLCDIHICSFLKLHKGKNLAAENSIDTMPSKLSFPKMKAERQPCYWARREGKQIYSTSTKVVGGVGEVELHEGIRTKREALRPLGDKGFWYKEERSRYVFGSHNTDCGELSCCSPIVTPLWRSPFGAGQSHSPSQHTSQQTEPHLLCPTICYKPNASENSFRIGLLTKKRRGLGREKTRSLLHFIPTAPFPFPPPHTPICYIWKIFHNI